jgi:type IV secretory pathway VirB10-like protein
MCALVAFKKACLGRSIVRRIGMKFLQATAFVVILAMAGVSAARAQEPDDKEKQKQQEEEKKKQPAPKEQPKPEDRKAQQPVDKEKERQDLDKQKQQTNEREDKKKADQKQYASQSRSNASAQDGNRNNSRKIPQEKFQASFGREHHFRVQKRDDRRVAYGGYTFEYTEAWPAAWSWDDDFYIEEDGDGDAYYLVDLTHPGIRLLVVIAD